MGLLNPGDQLVVALIARAASARDEDDVGLRRLAQSMFGAQRQSARVGALAPRLGRDEDDFGAWQAAQDFVGADRI